MSAGVLEVLRYVGGPRDGDDVTGPGALSLRILAPTLHSARWRHLYTRSGSACVVSCWHGTRHAAASIRLAGTCYLYIGEIEVAP